MKSAALALALTGSVLAQDDWNINPWTLPANSLAALRTTVTSKIHKTVTVCPCLETPTTIATAPQYTVTGGYGHDTSSESDVTKTIEISKYTTICPVTETHVSSGTTYTKTYSTVSTVTSSISIPVTYPTSASWTTTTETGYSTFTSLCTTEYHGSTTVETHTHSKPVYTTKTVPCTETASASKTGSVIGAPYPIPSGSSSKIFPSGTVVSGSVISGTASASAPFSSGATKSSSTPSSSPTGECKRCEGQPGEDEFCGYTIKDNYYKVTPNTCRTVEYDFTVTDSTVAPDGIARPALIVNNQMPGPKIEASWGDWIQVTVHNQMKVNGSSIHFHGMRQHYTNEMDGVPSITQCPLAPGESQTYKFRATNYGTSWWHSHFALQTYEGVFGPMIIHGPIDEELSYDSEQVLLLQDWSHATADELFWPSEAVSSNVRGGAPTLDTGLINGLNVWGADGSASQSGKRFEMTVTKGQTYRFRIVNSAIASTFKFFIDGHKFKVITSDFVPIKPYETDILNINIGQRYDILVTFDQAVGNYWMRSENQAACNTIVQQGNIKGVVRYAGASHALPTSTAYTYTDECVDEPIASLVPIVALDAGASTKTVDETVVIGANGGSPNLYKWTLSGTSFQTQWGAPTLQQIYENGTAPSYRGSIAIDVPTLGEWVYVIIDTPIPVTHPIHLHGHDFMILAQGTGLYTNQPLNTKNPARRDVVNMPAGRGVGGYVVIAFQADNPGAWLLHCHIGWHVAMGFALQIIENLEGIKDTITSPDMLTDTCASWSKYSNANNIFAAPWESGVYRPPMLRDLLVCKNLQSTFPSAGLPCREPGRRSLSKAKRKVKSRHICRNALRVEGRVFDSHLEKRSRRQDTRADYGAFTSSFGTADEVREEAEA
nr:laccase-2 [Quercus suber]